MIARTLGGECQLYHVKQSRRGSPLLEIGKRNHLVLTVILLGQNEMYVEPASVVHRGTGHNVHRSAYLPVSGTDRSSKGITTLL
jgi:hypothetical protein